MPTDINAQVAGYKVRPERMKTTNTFPIYQVGLESGSRQAIKAVLDELEQMYMSDDLERGSVEAKAILDVTRRLGKLAREFKPEAKA